MKSKITKSNLIYALNAIMAAVALVFMFSISASAEDNVTGQGDIFLNSVNLEEYPYWVYNCETNAKISQVNVAITNSNKKLALYYDPICGINVYNYNLVSFHNRYKRENGDIYYDFWGSFPEASPHTLPGSSNIGNTSTIVFQTNIPIFANYAAAESYVNGITDMYSALNYNRIYDIVSGWVNPYLNTSVNNNEVPYPVIENINFNGFDVVDMPEHWCIDVGVEVGLSEPYSMEYSSKPYDDAVRTNLGFITENSEVGHSAPEFRNLDYNADASAAAWTCINEFYASYPSYDDYTNNSGYSIDGNMKLQQYWLPHCTNTAAVGWSKWRDVDLAKYNQTTATDLVNFKQAYVEYKLRYYYFDDNSGYQYGPFITYKYYANGSVEYNQEYYSQGSGSIPVQSGTGTQDETGSINYNEAGTREFGFDGFSANDVTGAFGYINSVFTNIDQSFTTFAAVFGAVFTCLPDFLVWTIFAGMCIMVVIGIAKVIFG